MLILQGDVYTCGDIPSDAGAARLLHYYYSCRPMRARRPEVAVSSYAGPIARLPIARTYITAPAGDIVRRVSRDLGVCTRTTAVVGNSYAALVGDGSRLCGCAQALAFPVWRVPCRLS